MSDSAGKVARLWRPRSLSSEFRAPGAASRRAAIAKSRGNVVAPDAMVDRYGADTCRFFLIFAAPPERDMDWNEQGVEGCHRFLERVWRLASTRVGPQEQDRRVPPSLLSPRET